MRQRSVYGNNEGCDGSPLFLGFRRSLKAMKEVSRRTMIFSYVDKGRGKTKGRLTPTICLPACLRQTATNSQACAL